MTKEHLLKLIAESGYNVGFGAKKHFATYDIVSKVPSAVGFVSMAIGVFALIFEGLSVKWLSALFIVLGMLGVCINIYDNKKHLYSEAGEALTKLFNDLKKLYYEVKSSDEKDLTCYQDQLEDLEKKHFAASVSDQILLSDWYAHYKFFWQNQIEWIDEQKNFKFLRDKIPLSLTVFTIILLLGLAIIAYINFNKS